MVLLTGAVKEKIIPSSTFSRKVSQTLFRGNMRNIGTTAMGFCSRGERLGSTQNTRKSDNI